MADRYLSPSADTSAVQLCYYIEVTSGRFTGCNNDMKEN